MDIEADIEEDIEAEIGAGFEAKSELGQGWAAAERSEAKSMRRVRRRSGWAGDAAKIEEAETRRRARKRRRSEE